MAVQTGIEPAISCVTGRHVNRYTTGPFGCGDRTWTCDLRVMSPTSYQLLHPAMWLMVAWDGIEPPTQGFSVLCSTDWATKPNWCLGPESNRHGCHHPQDFKSCASTSSATQAFRLFQGTRLFFKNGVLQRTRTSDPLIKSQMLYQLS